MRLKGKVAVVTGGGSGNGRGIALGMAREGAGVFVPDLNLEGARETARLIEAEGGRAWPLEVDVTTFQAVKTLLEKVKAEAGGVDILVNNVGLSVYAPFLEITEELWQKTMDVNLKATFVCTQTVVPHMVETGRKGSIINIASVAGIIGLRGLVHYGAAKAGVILLTKTVALEVAPSGIRVNAIAPGIIHTPANDTRMKDPEKVKAYLANVPLNRIGKPVDLVGAAVFLASDESSYMTGTVLTVDGGWTAG